MINGFLKLCDTIGKGAFCKVKKAVGTFDEDDGTSVEEPFAIKIYNKQNLRSHVSAFHGAEGLLQMKTMLDQVYNEVRIWEKLDDKNVVKIFELFDDVDHHNMYLVMQFCDLGQLAFWNEEKKEFTRNEKIYQNALEAAEMKYFDDDYSEVEKVAKHIFR